MSTPSTEVGPGFLAFVVFFSLALALWLLMRSMFARVRRVNLAQRAQESGWDLTSVEEKDLLHVYSIFPVIPESRRALRRTLEFLK